jgi:hypothetical protein
MEIPDEYIKGFNNGYLLRKHHPMLVKELEDGIKGKSPYLSGLKAGSKEYEKELDQKLERIKQSKEIDQRSKGQGLNI